MKANNQTSTKRSQTKLIVTSKTIETRTKTTIRIIEETTEINKTTNLVNIIQLFSASIKTSTKHLLKN